MRLLLRTQKRSLFLLEGYQQKSAIARRFGGAGGGFQNFWPGEGGGLKLRFKCTKKSQKFVQIAAPGSDVLHEAPQVLAAEFFVLRVAAHIFVIVLAEH